MQSGRQQDLACRKEQEIQASIHACSDHPGRPSSLPTAEGQRCKAPPPCKCSHHVCSRVALHHSRPVWVGAVGGVGRLAADGCGVEQDLRWLQGEGLVGLRLSVAERLENEPISGGDGIEWAPGGQGIKA